jgi:hypothetical protein
LKLFNSLSVPSLLCVFEILTLEQRDVRRLETAYAKLKRETPEYGLMDPRRNRDIPEPEVDPIGRILTHVNRNDWVMLQRIWTPRSLLECR